MPPTQHKHNTAYLLKLITTTIASYAYYAQGPDLLTTVIERLLNGLHWQISLGCSAVLSNRQL